MASPSPDLPPGELWLQITRSPRPHRLVDFPRVDHVTGLPMGQIAIWILTQEESMICQKAADQHARAMLKENSPRNGEPVQGYEDLYRNEAANQVLYRACRRPNDLKYPAFPSPGEMRKHFSSDEIGVLMNHYNTIRAQLGPIIAELTMDELDEWTGRLMEGGGEYFLDLLSSGAKTALVGHLVSRLRSYATVIGSRGAPPDASSSESENNSSPADDPVENV